jgi:hypothetical protein
MSTEPSDRDFIDEMSRSLSNINFETAQVKQHVRAVQEIADNLKTIAEVMQRSSYEFSNRKSAKY